MCMAHQAGHCSNYPQVRALQVSPGPCVLKRSTLLLGCRSGRPAAATAEDVATINKLAYVQHTDNAVAEQLRPASQIASCRRLRHATAAASDANNDQYQNGSSQSCMQLHRNNGGLLLHAAAPPSGSRSNNSHPWGSLQHQHTGWLDRLPDQHSLALSVSSAVAAAGQQLELLPHQQQQRQAQHAQHGAEWLLAQQQADRLQSNGQALTASKMAAQYVTASQKSLRISSADSSLGNGHSNSSSVNGSGAEHCSQQHQQHPQQKVAEQSASDAGAEYRRAMQQQQQVLVRPTGGNPAAGARGCSPAQLAALSDVLQMPITAAQKLLDRYPQLLQHEPTSLHTMVQQLADTLNISYKTAAYMAAKQPLGLLVRPAEKVQQSVQQLAAALHVQASTVVTAAATAPSLLVRPLPGLLKRVAGLCQWFAVSPSAALSMVAAAPELLTDSVAGTQKRATAVGTILLLRAVCVQRLVASCPHVLFMSPRILNNKVRVLMAVLNKDRKAVGQIVYKTPELLLCNLEHLGASYQLLLLAVQRQDSFVFAMAAHNGRLLLLPPSKLLIRGARLLAALQMVPDWQQQWRQLRPPQVEQCLASNHIRFERLEYLISTRQAASISIFDALRLTPVAFVKQHSSWPAWLAAEQQRLRLKQQQGCQQQGQQQLQQPQQHSYQPQPRRQQLVCGGPGGPLSPQQVKQQQQWQAEYKQHVHQSAKQLGHRHKQRQQQLQHHRAQLLQQQALQWQQMQKQLQKQRRQHLQPGQPQLQHGNCEIGKEQLQHVSDRQDGVSTAQQLMQQQQQQQIVQPQGLLEPLPACGQQICAQQWQPAQQVQQMQNRKLVASTTKINQQHSSCAGAPGSLHAGTSSRQAHAAYHLPVAAGAAALCGLHQGTVSAAAAVASSSMTTNSQLQQEQRQLVEQPNDMFVSSQVGQQQHQQAQQQPVVLLANVQQQLQLLQPAQQAKQQEQGLILPQPKVLGRYRRRSAAVAQHSPQQQLWQAATATSVLK